MIEPFIISREFNAPRKLVWKAWTERDRLLEWFGPKGFKMTTADLDFRPGGKFHYCMKTPNGMEMWGMWLFREIDPPNKIVLINHFSDAAGGIAHHPMSPTWPRQTMSETMFEERGNKTLLTIRWSPYEATPEEVQTFDSNRPGMTMGWSGTFEQLDEYLARG